MPFLQVNGLQVYFVRNGGFLSSILRQTPQIIKAVDDVSFEVTKKGVLGVVGETGCGKTTLGRAVLALIKSRAGQVFFEGRNILKFRPRELRNFRLDAQMIFQDPIRSLDPKMKVKDSIAEPIKTHGMAHNKVSLLKQVKHALDAVDLSAEHQNKYPFQLSGGEARRVTLARSLALHPSLLVCDEPTAGLDVSISAKILNVMNDVRKEFGLTYIWISHNLHEVAYMSDNMIAMYLGKIVELGSTSALFQNPSHPYTKVLLSSLPRFGAEADSAENEIALINEVPSPINPPPICRFYKRCADRMPVCEEKMPELTSVEENHKVACLKFVTERPS